MQEAIQSEHEEDEAEQKTSEQRDDFHGPSPTEQSSLRATYITKCPWRGPTLTRPIHEMTRSPTGSSKKGSYDE
jgi:hypothetical protein